MNTWQTLHMLLGLRHKITDQGLRMMYMKDVWGMEQADIGLCENMSQSNVSRELKAARLRHGKRDDLKMIQFDGEEIKMIQALPREVLTDTQCIAFVHDVLGIYPIHPFYDLFNHNTQFRIVALYQLGMSGKKLSEIFGKAQSTISMMVKRHEERTPKLERGMRNDNLDKPLKLRPERYQDRYKIKIKQ